MSLTTFQSGSLRDKNGRLEPLRLDSLRSYDPPMIMTTAATPQDSPNAGNDGSFPNWDGPGYDMDMEPVNNPLVTKY